MKGLFIGGERVLSALTPSCLYSTDLNQALKLLKKEEVELVIIDQRQQNSNQLATLLADLPITTRVVALVDNLPTNSMCSESGVIFMTPPIKDGMLANLIASLNTPSISTTEGAAP